jgi:hypothetical protein
MSRRKTIVEKYPVQKRTAVANEQESLTDLHFRAAEESGLAEEYANNPELLRFYMRRLLRKGWANQKTSAEARYIAAVHKAQGKYQGNGERLRRPHQMPRIPPSISCTDASEAGKV